jgi:hypothetical protein
LSPAALVNRCRSLLIAQFARGAARTFIRQSSSPAQERVTESGFQA